MLVAHHTTVRGRLVTTTVETVRFARPERVDFRLTRGPVPHVVEQFMLEQQPHGTRLSYRGELGTDAMKERGLRSFIASAVMAEYRSSSVGV